MAPSGGPLHKLVVRNWKLFKYAANRVAQSLKPVELKPAYARVAVNQPVHPRAFLRQLKSRSYHTFVRAFHGPASAVKPLRSSYPTSRTSRAVGQLTGRTPFASTLRPNLTGGTLGRTSGGYSIGGGARYFSHSPSAPAEVIQNVSQAVRTFYLAGNKAQYHGQTPRGEKQYRSISAKQDAASRRTFGVPKATPGSSLLFAVNPTLTALTPLDHVPGFTAAEACQPSLAAEGLLNVLSADFTRALKDLAAVLNDLKRLADFGDLPISYDSAKGALKVHFAGCDSQTVESLCDDIGVTRGIVVQDPDFDSFVGTEIALLFPFAESQPASSVSFEDEGHELFVRDVCVTSKPARIDWREMVSVSSEASNKDEDGSQFDFFEEAPSGTPPVQSSLGSPGDGYESLRYSEADEGNSPLEYRDDLEGIYRFLALCDDAQRVGLRPTRQAL